MNAAACPASSLTLALILGNPGNDEEQIGKQKIETPALPCVWWEHVQIKEFLEESGCVINSGTACDTDLDRYNCLDRIGAFFKHQADLYFLAYLGDGSESNGSWILAAETIALDDIVDCWTRYHKEDNSKLLVYSDSCHSGHLVAKARHYKEQGKPWYSRIFVQASCACEEKAMDGRFTPMWIEAHRRPPSTPFDESAMDTFLQGGDTTQTPTFYAHGKLHIGSLEVRFLQGSKSDAGDNKACWEVIRDELPNELKPIVDNFAFERGWERDPQFLQFVLSIRGLAQREDRRGGSSEEDYTDLLDFFNEKIGDATLQLKALVEEFEEEFC